MATQQQYIETLYAFCSFNGVKEDVVAFALKGKMIPLIAESPERVEQLMPLAQAVGEREKVRIVLKTFHCISQREI